MEKKVSCFIGSPGSGKSTLIAKIVSRLVKNCKRPFNPFIIGMNSYNLGGNSFIEKFAQVIDIKYKSIDTFEELRKIIKYEEYDYIIDTNGMNHYETDKINIFYENTKDIKNIQFIPVFNAGYKEEILFKEAESYRIFDFRKCGVTHLDLGLINKNTVDALQLLGQEFSKYIKLQLERTFQIMDNNIPGNVIVIDNIDGIKDIL